MLEANLEALDNRNSKYDAAVLEARATRQTLEKQLKGKKPADLPQVEAAEAKARSERDQALQAWRTADQNVIRLNDTKKNLVAKQAAMAGLDARYKVVGTLADVACGLKGSKVSLQRYILGVLLDDVLVQSTQRLMKMSDGRYELRRKLDPGRRNRAAGLDLEVYDDYSGESRSVSTLSGGESFMAALSLALGLSDVVQAQTGGIQLDTLFVDEGFGTLDSEALELAVSTLMDLQRAGRMVGIISHVSELKEQMDIRIDLTKSNQGGSSLKVVSPMMGGV
jgi:exonuclease SbcC